MTQVFPISTATPAQPTSTPAPPTNQFGEDTFLKLLVAQLQYQDPLSPTDQTQFITQTAQFTELETLQKIEAQQEAQTKSNQMLSAAAMVGRNVTYSITQAFPGQPSSPTGTTAISMRGTLPIDAANGATATAQTKVFTNDGQTIPLKLEFVHGTGGWTVQAMNGDQALGDPVAMSFDTSNHPTNDLTIPSSALDEIPSTAGQWPPTGITLAFGSTDDPTRLQLASGPATVAAIEQNGNDGNNVTGLVTGIHMTTDGPTLIVGGKSIPLASITDVAQ